MIEDVWLVGRINRGDNGALHRIYEKYKHDLVTLAGALLADTSAADDVVHDVFVSFIERARQFRLTGSLKGFLCTCVANRARNRNASESRSLRSNGLQAAESPEVRVQVDEQVATVERALVGLPYEQREVLALRIYGDMRFREIARELRVSINTVQGRYRYAMQKLRNLLDDGVSQ